MNFEKIKVMFENNNTDHSPFSDRDFYNRCNNNTDIISNLNLKINYNIVIDPNDVPHWNFNKNIVSMPPTEWFPSVTMYYRILFHELIHSTNTPLGRLEWAKYSRIQEEIIADLGCAMLMDHFGMEIDITVLAYVKKQQDMLEGRSLVIFEDATAPKNIDFYLSKAKEAYDYLIDNNIIEKSVA